jgi:phosphoenolpyruvate carboxylase
MATQHPDNAGAPWWRRDAFIPTQDEIDELLLLFRELPIDEYMWDWEGKYVDESVGEKLFSRAQEYFKEHPLGSEKHLTYRIPAFDGDRMHRMARAFMNILSLADLARDIGLPMPPVAEMFLPLTTDASQPLQVRKVFRDVAGYHRAIFHPTPLRPAGQADDRLLELLEVTPLVEDVQSLFGIEQIVRPYWEQLLKERGSLPRGQRVFLARSDPALNDGLVPAVLAVKAALSTVTRVGEELGLVVHPIIGTGSLPFRGRVNPTHVDAFLEQYAGTRTYSIQSAFRYDYPLDAVRGALERIRTEAPRKDALRLEPAEISDLRALADAFAQFWKPSIEALAPMINRIAEHVPQRRERLQHIGLFGYSRGVGSVKLPRAIGFTAALYSLGIPPELIGAGRGLKAAHERKLLPVLDRFYPSLRKDLERAGHYLNRENLDLLARRDRGFAAVQGEIADIERMLSISLGPKDSWHMLHRNVTSTMFHLLHEPGMEDAAALQDAIAEAGKLRRSLG